MVSQYSSSLRRPLTIELPNFCEFFKVFLSIENICRSITPRAQIFIVTSATGRFLFNKQANELKSDTLTAYKCFSSHFPLQ